MGKNKAMYLIQDGIAYFKKIDLGDIVQKTKFSLLIDESAYICLTSSRHCRSLFL